MAEPNFCWPIRVYYEDTDSGGVVYYANYLKFLERARTEWLRSLGLEQDQLRDSQKLLFMVRSVKLQYHAAARFNELLQVDTHIQALHRVRVIFWQAVRREQQILCSGTVEIACVDSQTAKPRRLPAQLAAQLFKEN